MRRNMKPFLKSSISALCALGLIGAAGLLAGCNVEKVGGGGRIGITSEPSTAEIFLNGSLQGATPKKLTGLAPGEYVVELRKEGFKRSYRKLVLVEGREVNLRVELELTTGLLLVESTPAGSEVLIEGESRGTTPALVMDLPLGEYTVELRSAGLPVRTAKVELEDRVPGQVSITHAPRVAVNSYPPGAEIFVDEELAGVAPLVLSDVPEGEHRIAARLELYDSQSETVTLAAGLNDAIEFRMDKNSGTLVLDTEPAMVEVFVDGVLVGTTQPNDGADSMSRPLRIALKAGVEHKVQLVREGYSSASSTVQTEIDQVITRHEVLKRIFVYDTRITTDAEVIPCRVEYKLPNGDIYYERFPGVYDTARAAEIRDVQPVSINDIFNREARRLIELNKQSEL